MERREKKRRKTQYGVQLEKDFYTFSGNNIRKYDNFYNT